ncbi:MAG: hypothetical protein NTY96_00380 [Bacteroidetes bacterium]|nr:hypothetical protein [Bacteroidota bacterium]
MTTEALDKCLNLLNYSMDHDQAKIDILSNMDTDFHKDYVQPFRRELGLNLLSKVTFPEKKDLIIFYIDELDTNTSISEFYENIEPVDIENDGPIYPIWYRGQYETDKLGVSEVRAHYLFALLFYEIQYYCNIYHVPFIEICEDRFFELNFIDIDPTLVNKECHELTRASIKIKQNPVLEGKPIFILSSVQQIFNLLKEYFAVTDQPSFLNLLQGGDNASKSLIFLGSGNRLADSFKQLYDCEIIKGCSKKDLENWICMNFVYHHRGKIQKFKKRYLNDIISTSGDKCRKPILNVTLEKATGNYLITKV